MYRRASYPDWYRLAIYGLVALIFITLTLVCASLLFGSTYASVAWENKSVNGSLPSSIFAIGSPVFIYGIPMVSIIFIFIIFIVFGITIILIITYLIRRTSGRF
ncbi:MAG: hypothetical protein GXO26_02820 [Crenarchaeota archaeon]|nr:hypothetical protein [Thermoproteota archaeon]